MDWEPGQTLPSPRGTWATVATFCRQLESCRQQTLVPGGEEGAGNERSGVAVLLILKGLL